jgi:hypothetical protein
MVEFLHTRRPPGFTVSARAIEDEDVVIARQSCTSHSEIEIRLTKDKDSGNFSTNGGSSL